MARMKRVVNRYGKITLASLGGILVTLGTFLILLSAATVTQVANAEDPYVCEYFYGADPDESEWDSCSLMGDYNGDGDATDYYCCRTLPAPCPTPAATCDSGCNGESGYDGPTQTCGTSYPTNYRCDAIMNTCVSCRCNGTPSIKNGQIFITCNCQ